MRELSILLVQRFDCSCILYLYIQVTSTSVDLYWQPPIKQEPDSLSLLESYELELKVNVNYYNFHSQIIICLIQKLKRIDFIILFLSHAMIDLSDSELVLPLNGNLYMFQNQDFSIKNILL